MARLSRADMEAALAFAAEVGSAASQYDRADQWLLERIAGLIGLEVAAYSQFDASGRLRNDAAYPAESLWEPTEHEWQLLRTQNPFSHYAERMGDRYFSARRLTDVVDIRAFRRTELYEVVSTELPHAVQMRMTGEPGSIWIIEVARSGRNYAERDFLLMDALRPSLMAYEAQRALGAVLAELQAVRRDPVDDDVLSARENEVLNLVAAGASNGEIAERLWISPGTVRKHLEHIYLKLEVGSRTAALARTGRSSAPVASDPS